ncbi:uncharacterized protein [Parasteatoda tepidariorum]|uniref:uncharacterized protein n=1 Tax=Parasteatoda tepidariorum TaxID=114398 RepID=UPI00077FBEF3|nr:uncharacterized protein LOC107437047 [Parasteatoda tepidariorum]
MNLVLPSTVEDINRLQQSYEMTTSKDALGFNKGFENIFVEKRYKREVSLPDGIKNWDIDNIQTYLNFEEENYGGFKAIESAAEDMVVPEDGNNSRLRCDSYSSMTSSMDDRMFFQGMGVKTINTICVDSGSTCISAADHSPLLNSSSDSIFRTMDPEETYQNLENFLQQVPEVSENLPSPLSVSGSESNFEMLHGSYFLPATCTQDSLPEVPRGTKRPASTSSELDIFSLRTAKQQCPSPVQYNDVRRKNNIASKNCRKTRKEKQKEMEMRVSELEKEKEGLRVEVQVLEELIQAHKMQLYAILKKR